MPPPSSIVAPPVVIPINGATAPYWWPSPKSARLELGVRALVRAVVPVEAAAHLGGAHQQRQQHAAEERFVLVGARAGVRTREDRGRGLAAELVHRKLRVGSSPQRVRARFDERFDERPVLVERRPVVGAVLLEGERQVGAALQLLEQRAERAEAESPETVEELRSAHDHNCAYAVFGSSPFWHPGHQ